MFVGRRDEILALRRRFDGGARLVTLVGPPGAGKTRLATQFGLEGASRGRASAWFVDLTSAVTAQDLVRAVAHALGVPLIDAESDAAAVSRLAHALASRDKVLLVLDNFEQLIASGAEVVAEWLARTTVARFLVTSRERLAVAGESWLELGPLPERHAVDLFVARARAVRPDFALRRGEKPVVCDLVQRLDRIPLAIELAAAHADVLTPAELLQRLDARFDLLRDGAPAGRGKLATLEGAIDWSWDLLDASEKRALARCAVFEGSFTVTAAEALLADAQGLRTPLALVQSLRSKSLLHGAESRPNAPELRVAMYESVRAFARAKLRERADFQDAVDRHTALYVTHANDWGARAEGPKAAEALAHLEADLANMTAVLRRDGADVAGAEILTSLEPLFRQKGPLGSYVELLDAAVARLCGPQHALLRARLVCTRAAARGFGWRDEARAEALEILGVARAHGDASLEVRALQNLAEHVRHKEPKAALARLEEATIVAKRVGDPRLEGLIAMSLGQAQISLARGVSELEAPQDTLERALATFRRGGCRALEGVVLDRIGDLYWHRGEFARSKALHEESLRVHREVGNRWAEGVALDHLSGLLLELGLAEEALPRSEEALAIHRATGNRFHETQALWTRGQILEELGRCAPAESSYLEALAIRDAASARVNANLLGYLGIVLFELGRLDEARARLEDAVTGCREAFPTREGLFLAYLSAVRGELGDADDGRRLFDEAMARVRETGDTALAASLAPLEGFVDLALARTARDHGDEDWEGERIARARARLLPGDGQPRARLEARPALRVLRRALYGESRRPPVTAIPPVLVMGPGARWFRMADGPRVDLSRREPMRRILEALADHRQRGAGRLSVREMIAAGWPEDAESSQAGMLRLYTAVRRLRNLGLRDVLRTTSDGYFLDAAVDAAGATERTAT